MGCCVVQVACAVCVLCPNALTPRCQPKPSIQDTQAQASKGTNLCAVVFSFQATPNPRQAVFPLFRELQVLQVPSPERGGSETGSYWLDGGLLNSSTGCGRSVLKQGSVGGLALGNCRRPGSGSGPRTRHSAPTWPRGWRPVLLMLWGLGLECHPSI